MTRAATVQRLMRPIYWVASSIEYVYRNVVAENIIVILLSSMPTAFERIDM